MEQGLKPARVLPHFLVTSGLGRNLIAIVNIEMPPHCWWAMPWANLG